MSSSRSGTPSPPRHSCRGPAIPQAHELRRAGALCKLAVAALGALIASLVIRCRRVFLRVRPNGRRTVVSIGGLAKGEDPGLRTAIEDLLARIDQQSGTNRSGTNRSGTKGSGSKV